VWQPDASQMRPRPKAGILSLILPEVGLRKAPATRDFTSGTEQGGGSPWVDPFVLEYPFYVYFRTNTTLLRPRRRAYGHESCAAGSGKRLVSAAQDCSHASPQRFTIVDCLQGIVAANTDLHDNDPPNTLATSAFHS